MRWVLNFICPVTHLPNLIYRSQGLWNDVPSLCWAYHWSLGGPAKPSGQKWSRGAVVMRFRVTESYPCRTCPLVFLIHIFKNSLSLYTEEKTKAQRGGSGFLLAFWVSLIRVGLGGERGVLILMLHSVLFPQVCPREEWPQGMNLQWLSLSCWV